MEITINESQRIDDSTGKSVTRYTPTLTGKCTATGSLTFACWEIWTNDSPEIHEQAKNKAIDNVKQVLASIIFDLTR
jgi:hypothetical protein